MSEYISREAALEVVERYFAEILELNPDICLDGIKSIPAADVVERPRWVSVTERLPEDGEYVLVRYKNNDMAVACVFDRDENFTFWRAQTDEGWCADCDTEPTHWMPLPEPPMEEA